VGTNFSRIHNVGTRTRVAILYQLTGRNGNDGKTRRANGRDHWIVICARGVIVRYYNTEIETNLTPRNVRKNGLFFCILYRTFCLYHSKRIETQFKVENVNFQIRFTRNVRWNVGRNAENNADKRAERVRQLSNENRVISSNAAPLKHLFSNTGTVIARERTILFVCPITKKKKGGDARVIKYSIRIDTRIGVDSFSRCFFFFYFCDPIRSRRQKGAPATTLLFSNSRAYTLLLETVLSNNRYLKFFEWVRNI